MVDAVTEALTSVLGWVGTVVKSLLGSGETAGALAPLLPLLAVGVAISVFLFGLKAIRSVTWGA